MHGPASIPITHNQRTLLSLVALIGLIGPNGVFIYFALFQWNAFMEAMRNPVTLAFVSEAFLLMGLLAVFFALRPIGRWGWKTFLVLSLFGGLGFGLPAFVVLNSPKNTQ